MATSGDSSAEGAGTRAAGLAALRKAALAAGCAAPQFNFAMQLMGGYPDPVALARYLKQHSFVPANFEMPGE